jgi:hypothetical protein
MAIKLALRICGCEALMVLFSELAWSTAQHSPFCIYDTVISRNHTSLLHTMPDLLKCFEVRLSFNTETMYVGVVPRVLRHSVMFGHLTSVMSALNNE